MWPSAGNHAAPEMTMVGLRDVFVVTPTVSFQPILPVEPPADLGCGGVGIGVLPLLPSLSPSSVGAEEAGVMMLSRGRGGGIQFYGSGSDPNSGVGTCHDCGNQAKKDCSHRRCRSCCKSRGFECSTHIKSTWVPAARRRERQMLAGGGDGAGAGMSSESTSGGKKPRLIASQTTANSHTSTSNTPSRSFDTTSAHQDHVNFKRGKLPEQVRAAAVFKCVRVTAVEDGGNEFAYQAVVRIGGHVFKGYLYDHGLDPNPNHNPKDNASTHSPLIDLPDVYPTSGAGGGVCYGNPINLS